VTPHPPPSPARGEGASLRGKVVVVTGGSGGIGGEICRHFAQAGATVVRVNWRAAFAAVRAFRPLLERGGAGLVVNISSIAGVTGMGSNVAYCASKAALDCMTKSLARALAPEIRVVSVSPGLVDTAFVKALDRTWRDEQAARTPLRRLATPDEVGAAVLAVASVLGYSNGCIIPVDGGRPLT